MLVYFAQKLYRIVKKWTIENTFRAAKFLRWFEKYTPGTLTLTVMSLSVVR